MADDKKRVLYLSQEAYKNPAVPRVLGDRYDVQSYLCENLDDLPDLVDPDKPTAQRYDALVTCIPKNPLTQSYAASLKMISSMHRKNPKMRIIAYTEAGPGVTWMFACGRCMDSIIDNNRGEFLEQDAVKIKSELDDLLGDLNGV